MSVPLGTYADEGSFALTAQAQDSRGENSVPVTRTLTVLNVAPTITNLTPNLTIKEGDRFNFDGTATDPGIYDVLTYNWDLDNNGLFDNFTGPNGQSSFADEGFNPIGLQVSDGDGGYAYGGFNVTVENVAPTITSITSALTVLENQKFDFAATATDPGILDLLSFDWDINNDGLFDDFTGAAGQWAFSNSGTYTVALRVSDGDGGFAFSSFDVTVEHVPEPSSAIALLAFGAVGAGAIRKRKHP